MLSLNANYERDYNSRNLENVFSVDALTIYSIPHSSIQSGERATSYKKRFNSLDSSNLDAFDFGAEHFEIWDGSNCLGGFRLSPIGDGQSEIEEVFEDFHFSSGSFELGRFWMIIQKNGNGRRCMAAISLWITRENIAIYFKQSSILGGVAKSLGGVSEGVYQWNPRLEYQCELLSFGVKKHG